MTSHGPQRTVMPRITIAVGAVVAVLGGIGIGTAMWIEFRHGARPPAPPR